MKQINKSTCLALVLLLTSAQSLRATDIKSYPAKDADFSRFKTFQWLPIKILTATGLVENDDRYSPLIRTSVGKQLTQGGLAESASAPDLKIVAVGLRDANPQLEEMVFSYGPAHSDFMLGGTTRTLGRYNKEGTLVINIIDVKNNTSVWVGMVTETIEKPSDVDRKLDGMVAKLFKKSPWAKK